MDNIISKPRFNALLIKCSLVKSNFIALQIIKLITLLCFSFYASLTMAMDVSSSFSRRLEPILALYQAEQWQQALHQSTQLQPKSEVEKAWLAQLQASIAINLQQPEKAYNYLQQALSYTQWPANQKAQLLRLRGDIATQQSRWKFAIEDYQAVLLLIPVKESEQRNDITLRLASSFYYNQQYQQALNLSDQLLQKSWQKPAALIRLSALSALHRYRLAAQEAERFITIEPQESRWWQQAISLNLSAKQGDRALALLQTAIDKQILNEHETRQQLTRLYAWQGLPYRGAILLDSALQKGMMQASIENQRLLAQLWENAREYERAIVSWTEIALSFSDSTARVRAIELLLLQGDTQSALNLLQHKNLPPLALNESLNKLKAQFIQTLIWQQNYSQALMFAQQLESQPQWQTRAKQWIRYIETATGSPIEV